jgi:simple sugar transport system permease protein
VSAPGAIGFVENLLAAGVSRGTPILLAAVGELLAERSGVLNLGVEGMMLLGAAVGYAVAHATGCLALGFFAAMAATALLSSAHAFVSVTLGGDQVVSGLGLGFFGAGLAAVVGADLVGVTGVPRAPAVEVELLARIPIVGPALFAQNAVVYVGIGVAALAWAYLYRTRWGLKLRAVGDNPTAADAQGVRVGLLRHLHVAAGGALAGLGGASLSLAITPGWVDGMTAGIGWIAVGLVIFGGWDPLRVALGAYLFGAIRRLPLDLQGLDGLPFLKNPSLGYFLDMLPYLFTIAVLVVAGLSRFRKRFAAPAALGTAFVRGERGR